MNKKLNNLIEKYKRDADLFSDYERQVRELEDVKVKRDQVRRQLRAGQKAITDELLKEVLWSGVKGNR